MPGCPPQLQAELFFGRLRPSGAPITPAEFDGFIARSITPRFPAGLTVLDGAGRWRAGTEPSSLVLIVVPPGPGVTERLDAIRADYKSEFFQQSVGVVLVQACGGF